MKRVADKTVHRARKTADQSGSAVYNRFEHRLHVVGRTGNDLEDVGGGCLPLQCLPSFVEQPHVLDRDQCLVAKRFGQRNFALAEGARLFAGQRQHADALIFAQQRQKQCRVDAGERLDASLVFGQLDLRVIRQMHHPFFDDRARRKVGVGIDRHHPRRVFRYMALR